MTKHIIDIVIYDTTVQVQQTDWQTDIMLPNFSGFSMKCKKPSYS